MHVLVRDEKDITGNNMISVLESDPYALTRLE